MEAGEPFLQPSGGETVVVRVEKPEDGVGICGEGGVGAPIARMYQSKRSKAPIRKGGCVIDDLRSCPSRMVASARAFSSEVDTGSREENASNQESRASVLIQSEPKML